MYLLRAYISLSCLYIYIKRSCKLIYSSNFLRIFQKQLNFQKTLLNRTRPQLKHQTLNIPNRVIKIQIIYYRKTVHILNKERCLLAHTC